MDAPAVPTASVVPDSISAAGARRHAAQSAAASEGIAHVPPSTHGHAKVVTESEPDDPVDGIVEAALRKATGEAKKYHEHIDHAQHHLAHEVDPHIKPDRRAGFGTTGARQRARARGARRQRTPAIRPGVERARLVARKCITALTRRRPRCATTAPAGSARSEARNVHGGRATRALHHGGPHTKTESLESDIAADAREYEAARAGLSLGEEEEEQEEEQNTEDAKAAGVPVNPVAPPLTPSGVSATVMPSELQ